MHVRLGLHVYTCSYSTPSTEQLTINSGPYNDDEVNASHCEARSGANAQQTDRILCDLHAIARKLSCMESMHSAYTWATKVQHARVLGEHSCMCVQTDETCIDR